MSRTAHARKIETNDIADRVAALDWATHRKRTRCARLRHDRRTADPG